MITLHNFLKNIMLIRVLMTIIDIFNFICLFIKHFQLKNKLYSIFYIGKN